MQAFGNGTHEFGFSGVYQNYCEIGLLGFLTTRQLLSAIINRNYVQVVWSIIISLAILFAILHDFSNDFVRLKRGIKAQ